MGLKAGVWSNLGKGWAIEWTAVELVGPGLDVLACCGAGLLQMGKVEACVEQACSWMWLGLKSAEFVLLPVQEEGLLCGISSGAAVWAAVN